MESCQNQNAEGRRPNKERNRKGRKWYQQSQEWKGNIQRERIRRDKKLDLCATHRIVPPRIKMKLRRMRKAKNLLWDAKEKSGKKIHGYAGWEMTPNWSKKKDRWEPTLKSTDRTLERSHNCTYNPLKQTAVVNVYKVLWTFLYDTIWTDKWWKYLLISKTTGGICVNKEKQLN